jgi:hypothetical protein
MCAADIQAGRVPGIRAIRSGLHVGQDKASQVQEYLRTITREIAARRGLKLHPVVCVVDEAQNLFGHEKHGKQPGDDATWIIKISPAFGVILVLATQRPDAKSLPMGVNSNVSQRFCLKVMDQIANDMVLGTSAYKTGLRAACTLSGVALGEDDSMPQRDVLAGLLEVLGDAPALHWAELAARLQQRFPKAPAATRCPPSCAPAACPAWSSRWPVSAAAAAAARRPRAPQASRDPLPRQRQNCRR